MTEDLARALVDARGASAHALDADPVFVSKTRGRIDPGNLARRVFKPAAHAAGVDWASFHSLRHYCAPQLFTLGLNAKQVQVWLGHHSPAFTLSTYVHLLSDELPESPFTASDRSEMEPDRPRPAETTNPKHWRKCPRCRQKPAQTSLGEINATDF